MMKYFIILIFILIKHECNSQNLIIYEDSMFFNSIKFCKTNTHEDKDSMYMFYRFKSFLGGDFVVKKEKSDPQCKYLYKNKISLYSNMEHNCPDSNVILNILVEANGFDSINLLGLDIKSSVKAGEFSKSEVYSKYRSQPIQSEFTHSFLIKLNFIQIVLNFDKKSDMLKDIFIAIVI